MTELSEGDKRIWNELWATVHTDHYACFYEEMVAEAQAGRWRFLDTVARVLTALTASGSTVAAWTLWVSSKTTSVTWAIISGAAALIAIIHTGMGVSDRIKEDTLIFSTFMQLRLDLEMFKKKMLLLHYESLTEFTKAYMEISAKFGKAHALKRPDFLLPGNSKPKFRTN